jgi:hypothetical protein
MARVGNWGLGAAVILAGSLTHRSATAHNYTALWARIIQLETSSGGYNIHIDGGLTNNSANDPANCDGSIYNIYTYKVDDSWGTPEAREHLARVVLSAFMSGKSVKMYVLDNSCSSDGKPRYTGIQTHRDF